MVGVMSTVFPPNVQYTDKYVRFYKDRIIIFPTNPKGIIYSPSAKVVVVAGRCVALSLVPALVWMHSLEACTAPVRPDEKVLLHWKQHWTWHSLLLQLLRMLLLVVLQVRLSSLLWGAEVAEVVVVAGWCGA